MYQQAANEGLIIAKEKLPKFKQVIQNNYFLNTSPISPFLSLLHSIEDNYPEDDHSHDFAHNLRPLVAKSEEKDMKIFSSAYSFIISELQNNNISNLTQTTNLNVEKQAEFEKMCQALTLEEYDEVQNINLINFIPKEYLQDPFPTYLSSSRSLYDNNKTLFIVARYLLLKYLEQDDTLPINLKKVGRWANAFRDKVMRENQNLDEQIFYRTSPEHFHWKELHLTELIFGANLLLAKLGNQKIQYVIGDYYLNGTIFTLPSPKEALIWFKKAAQPNSDRLSEINLMAEKALFFIYCSTKYNLQNLDEAKKCFEKIKGFLRNDSTEDKKLILKFEKKLYKEKETLLKLAQEENATPQAKHDLVTHSKLADAPLPCLFKKVNIEEYLREKYPEATQEERIKLLDEMASVEERNYNEYKTKLFPNSSNLPSQSEMQLILANKYKVSASKYKTGRLFFERAKECYQNSAEQGNVIAKEKLVRLKEKEIFNSTKNTTTSEAEKLTSMFSFNNS